MQVMTKTKGLVRKPRKQGKIRGSGFGVWDCESRDPEHELWTLGYNLQTLLELLAKLGWILVPVSRLLA